MLVIPKIVSHMLIAGFIMAGAGMVRAQDVPPIPAFVQDAVPMAQLVGEGMHTVAYWDMYALRLYAPEGIWGPERHTALTLRFIRGMTGDELSRRWIQDMRTAEVPGETILAHTTLAQWQSQLKAIIPDMQPGVELTVVASPGKATRFYEGSREIGRIADPRFRAPFLAMWLGENAVSPQLRRQLVGK